MADAGPAGAAHLPGAEEARLWTGHRLDAIDGTPSGRVDAVLVDAASGEPVWLVVRPGRFGGHTAIPFETAAEAGGRVWAPYDRELIRSGPRVDPEHGLDRELELELADHFAISRDARRRAEAATPGGPTAVPLRL
jgi:hypothetical protein